MTDRYAHYKALKFARPRPRILEVILSKPGKLNALDADGHRELAEVWRDIDRDPDTSVALLRGEGGAFSAGGDLGMIEEMTRDWATRTRVWKEASDLVYNVINCTKPIVAAIEGPCVGAGLAAAMVADITVAGRKARIIDGHTRLGVAAGDHCGDRVAAAVRHGQGQVLPAAVRDAHRRGGRAHRPRLDGGRRRQGGGDGARRRREAARHAAGRRALDQARAQQLAEDGGPHLRCLAGLEFMGFSGPEVQEGMTALKEKRKPKFDPKDPF